jgi:hypothetical protein
LPGHILLILLIWPWVDTSFHLWQQNSLVLCLTEFVNFVNPVKKSESRSACENNKAYHDGFLVRYKLWAGRKKNKALTTVSWSNTSCVPDGKNSKHSFPKPVGIRWLRDMTVTKLLVFFPETLLKLRFLLSFHLFVIIQPDGWVRHEG